MLNVLYSWKPQNRLSRIFFKKNLGLTTKSQLMGLSLKIFFNHGYCCWMMMTMMMTTMMMSEGWSAILWWGWSTGHVNHCADGRRRHGRFQGQCEGCNPWHFSLRRVHPWSLSTTG